MSWEIQLTRLHKLLVTENTFSVSVISQGLRLRTYKGNIKKYLKYTFFSDFVTI